MTHPNVRTSKQRQVEWGIIFVFWTFMATLTTANHFLDGRGPDPSFGFLAFSLFRFYLWALLTPAIFWLAHRFSIEETNWRWRVLLHMGLAFLIGFSIDLVTDLVRFYVIRPPWLEGTRFNPLEDLFALDFLVELTIYLGILAAGFARNYFLRYQERREQATQLEAQLAQARLETLRMQVNPHFLFNTLHAISSLVERDPKGVRRIIARLSELLRYTLEDDGQQEIPLRQELQFLDGYLEIQKIRFQETLQVEQTVAPDVQGALVPNLILQPLVENAIKHGVSQVNGMGYIEISAHREGKWLHLTVRDNGPGPPSSSQKGVGLRNVQSRLEALYGEMHRLTLTPNTDQEGVTARLSLPYHTAADLKTQSVETYA